MGYSTLVLAKDGKKEVMSSEIKIMSICLFSDEFLHYPFCLPCFNIITLLQACVQIIVRMNYLATAMSGLFCNCPLFSSASVM
ncbi:Uncharacterized protein TCM_018709 [Theobroma cacao]|uniref:Uncharacterized protein n=1 Tax=Theobroma cacao TaxID=3641 RepID=A0A061EF38_THECC|nr:Uncharacterized protein TCM_018709 [Theobroma cacao]